MPDLDSDDLANDIRQRFPTATTISNRNCNQILAPLIKYQNILIDSNCNMQIAVVVVGAHTWEICLRALLGNCGCRWKSLSCLGLFRFALCHGIIKIWRLHLNAVDWYRYFWSNLWRWMPASFCSSWLSFTNYSSLLREGHSIPTPALHPYLY